MKQFLKNSYQTTLKEKITFTGIGLFTGEKIKMTLHPAEADTGIVFKRIDLSEKPILKVHLDLVKESDRRTLIGFGKEAILTVEHLLSAISAYEIDNLIIEINGPEIPIYDGSSKEFAKVFEEIGTVDLDKKRKILMLEHPVYLSEGITHLIALPSDDYKISFTLHHPQNEFLKSQYFSYVVDKKTYFNEIAPSRTYSIYEEIKPLLDNNFIKGGSLDNAVVIKDDKVINSDGVRFNNEMVRHKILDLIGDLALIGNKFLAHIIAIRSGHLTNVKFAKKLKTHLKEYSA
ncbi:MAG: UDP-3-O-[3-hydroxymyristoyl] N-acetylglucosamine deacetylase [Parachlamydiales bacterium]|nr:UDP-3-O-[3-hydroxymyristoyl] N-acetylglucosamine deacetylase [Parachlamydiales bacterium]